MVLTVGWVVPEILASRTLVSTVLKHGLYQEWCLINSLVK